MKRILYMIAIMLSMNLVFSIYTNESIVQYRELSYIEEVASEKLNQKSVFLNINTDEANDFKSVYDIVYRYLNEHELIAISTVSENGPVGIIRNKFVFSKENFISDMYHIESDTDLDFLSTSSDQFYSSERQASENKIMNLNPNIFTRKQINYHIYPYAKYRESKKGVFAITIYSPNLNEEIVRLRDYLTDQNITSEMMSNDQNEELSEEQLLATTLQLSLLSLVAYLIIVIADVIHNNRRIFIYQLHGYSNTRIVSSLFLKNFLVTNGLFYLVLLVFTIAKVLPLNIANIAFVKQEVALALLFTGFNLLILLFLVVYVRMFTMGFTYKNLLFMRMTMMFNYAFKMILICIVMGLTVSSFLGTIQSFADFRDIRHIEQSSDYATFSGVPLEYAKEDLLSELLNTDQIVLCDFSQLSIEEYFPDREFDPVIEVNDNYLKDYQLYDENGELLSLDGIEEDVNLLPVKYKEDKTKQRYITTNTIFLQNNQTFYSVDPGTTKLKVTDPIIRVKSEKNLSIYDIYDFYMRIDDTKSVSFYRTLINEHMNNSDVYLVQTSSYIADLSQSIYLNLLQSASLFFLLVMIFLAFSYQNAYLFITLFKKELAIKSLHGYRNIEKYKLMYIITAITTVVPIVVYGFVNKFSMFSILGYLTFMLILEFLLISMMMLRFERKGIIETLKGE